MARRMTDLEISRNRYEGVLDDPSVSGKVGGEAIVWSSREVWNSCFGERCSQTGKNKRIAGQVWMVQSAWLYLSEIGAEKGELSEVTRLEDWWGIYSQ